MKLVDRAVKAHGFVYIAESAKLVLVVRTLPGGTLYELREGIAGKVVLSKWIHS